MEKGTIGVLMPVAAAIEPKVVMSLNTATNFACNHGSPVVYTFIVERMDVCTARNALVEAFLKSETEWSFWMDSDMILPIDRETFQATALALMVHRATEYGIKMLTGLYFQRQGEHRPVVYKRDMTEKSTGKAMTFYTEGDGFSAGAVYPGPGAKVPIEVDRAGFGCMLIHRDVYQHIEKPYFKFHYWDPANPEKYTSEDFYFCYKARKAGIKIFLTPEIRCGHLGASQIITERDFIPPVNDTVEIYADFAELAGAKP